MMQQQYAKIVAGTWPRNPQS